MIRTQVYLPEELYKEAKFYAKLRKISISEFMREGLESSIDSQKIKKKKERKTLASIVGTFKFGNKPTNAAATHNDIYDI